jgi:hypothetical protein
MVSENVARMALESASDRLHLEDCDEFVGLGVVPVRPHSSDMAVAVYVSKPASKLSKRFREKVPPVVDVVADGRRIQVETKILNIGDLRP